MASETKNIQRTSPDEVAKPEVQQRKDLPVLPVRDTVLFPHAVLPLTVGRESSVQLINSLGEEKQIIVVAQREARVDNPSPAELFQIGTLAVVHKVVKMPNQSLFVFTEGTQRVKISNYTQLTPYMRAEGEEIPEPEPKKTPELEALNRNVLMLFQQIVTGSPTLSDELQTVAMNIDEPGRLVDFIASSLPSLSDRKRLRLPREPNPPQHRHTGQPRRQSQLPPRPARLHYRRKSSHHFPEDKRKLKSALGHIDHNRVFQPLSPVVICQLLPQPRGVHSHHRLLPRIK